MLGLEPSRKAQKRSFQERTWLFKTRSGPNRGSGYVGEVCRQSKNGPKVFGQDTRELMQRCMGQAYHGKGVESTGTHTSLPKSDPVDKWCDPLSVFLKPWWRA